LRYYVSIERARASDPAACEHVVELVELPNGALQATVDGRPVDVDVAGRGDRLSVRVDGRVFDLTTDGRPPEFGVFAGGGSVRVRVETERMRSGGRGAGRSAGGRDRVIRSPMPGRVVQVLVSEGQSVNAGQGVVVLEAMKMENEVRARAAGVVARVHVAAGAAVEGNAPLVTFA